MRWLGIILALSISLGWIAFIPNEPVSDQGIYNQRAIDIAEGRGYIDDSGNPSAYWAPGYAYYLALFYKLFSPSPKTAFAANFIAYLFLVFGIYRMGALAYSKNAGLLAATIAALYPSFIMYNTVIASETLFSALAIWAAVFAWQGFEKKKGCILSGILFGAAALVRPVALSLPLAVFPIGFAKRASPAAAFWRFLLISIFMAAACLPWTVRNAVQLGEFVPVSANSGANLWIGNHEGATGGYTHLDEVLDKENLRNLPLVERDRRLKEEALEFIRENPGEFFKLMLKRLYITFKSESIAAVWNAEGIEKRFGKQGVLFFKILSNLAYFALAGAFIISLFRGSYVRADLFIFSMIFLLSLPFLIFMGQDRFHLPLVPYLILFVCKRFDNL